MPMNINQQIITLNIPQTPDAAYILKRINWNEMEPLEMCWNYLERSGTTWNKVE